MVAGADLIVRLDELVALFNRRSLDLPDALFDRRTQFLLNGVPYESMLGRSPSDPLVLMIARGGAGYRFIVKALQYAVPDARVERGTIEPPKEGGGNLCVPVWLSGHLRGTGTPIEVVLQVSIDTDGRGTITRADAGVDEGSVRALREARQTPDP